MKLIGSMLEQEIREQMIKSSTELFKTDKYNRLLKLLKIHFPEMKIAYFLAHTPEQSEDLFTILVNDDTIVKIEMDRYDFDLEPIIKIKELDDYQLGLSKTNQIKLLVAIELAKKSI